MVICQRCGRRPAVIQSQQLGTDGRPIFVNLCEVCFREIQERASQTNALDKYGRDLTAAAREGKLDPVIGRREQIERIIHVLSRRTKNNPVLLGDPGVGKTAIVEGLAQRIVEGKVPETLSGKRVVALDLALMVAGASHRGQFEQRLKSAIEEVVNAKGQIILFIDEVHTIVGAGAAEGAIDASNMLKPALARGELQVVGATTLDDYRQRIERDAALERRFQPVLVPESTLEETIEILKGLRASYEKHHHVKIGDEALQAAVELSDRYIADRFLPDKAIDLMDEAAAKVRLAAVKEPENLKQVEEELAALKKKTPLNEGRLAELERVRKEITELWTRTKMEEVPVVTRVDIAAIVSGMTGIPLSDLSEEERTKLLHLEQRIHARIVDQEEAVKVVSEAIRRSRVGLKDPKRPIGSFIFLGPTGVGKTELAKSLAEVLYGDEDLMVRLDMSEFMEKHTVSRLIGAPPGYIGFERGGQLTEIVRRKPFSIILLDEIEKAHPEVSNILLQIMEDGRLTDGHGRTVDFKNTILIMTSNLGSETLYKKALGFDDGRGRTGRGPVYENLKENLIGVLKKSFRPEFLNRVDDVVVFHPLSKENVWQIAQLLLKQTEKLLGAQGIKIKVTAEGVDYLVRNGYDPELGARPLRRLIQREIENKISDAIIAGEYVAGDTVDVDSGDDKLVFQVEAKVKSCAAKGVE